MKSHMKNFRYPFYTKLVLSIGLLICFPMLIIQIFLFSTSYHTLNNQNHQYYYLKTKSVSSYFYAQLANFREISMKISTNSEIAAKKLPSSANPPASMLQISKELTAISFIVPLAQTVGLYYPEQQIFLDTEYYYTLDNFCRSFSNGNSAVQEQCRSFFTHPMNGDFKIISSFGKNSSSENIGSGKMLLIFPVKMNSYTEYDAAVYFILNHQSITSFLSVDSPAENYTYAIFSDEGNLLFTNNLNNQSDLTGEDFRSYLQDPLQITYTFRDNATTAYKWSEPTGSSIFVNIVGESALEETNRNFLRTMGIVICVNLLVVAALLILTVYINYNPLRKLVSKVSSSSPNQYRSEFDQLEQVIHELDSRASEQGVVIMDYILNDLFYGMTVKQPELERLIPNFHFHFFCAVSVICRRPTVGQAKQIAEQIESQTGCRIYITDIPNNTCTLFVCLSKEAIDLNLLTVSISSAVQTVLEESCSVFAGSIVERLDDISSSYYASQAQIGSAASFAYGQDYPSTSLHLLDFQIAGNHISAATDSLDEIFAYIHRNRHDRTLCRYVCYEALSTYLSARRKASHPATDSEIHELLLFKDADDLHRMLKASLSELEQQLAQDTHEAENDQQQKIVDFVDQNFCHSDISLVTVADQFGISIYMVSRLFKNQTGTGFKEYITAKRLELARQLLTDTMEPISAIALKVGFENPTYFTSLFRARYGVAPSRYRDDALRK